MGRKQVQRGKRFEYRVVELARKAGLEAQRVVLSGAAREKGDVVIAGLRFECKYRSAGFEHLYAFLEEAKEKGCWGLIVSGRRTKPLVVLPLSELFALLGGVVHGRPGEGKAHAESQEV